MFWKKLEKSRIELERKLLKAEADLSFLNAKSDSFLGEKIVNSLSEKENLHQKYADFLLNLSPLTTDSTNSINQEIQLLQDLIQLYTSVLPEPTYHKVDWDIEDQETPVPALILFPIVTNALIHGYNKMEKYPLKIKLRIKSSLLQLEVSNRVNHYLINQADHPLMQQLESRLKYFYSDSFNLFVNSNSNLFKVTLTIKFH